MFQSHRTGNYNCRQDCEFKNCTFLYLQKGYFARIFANEKRWSCTSPILPGNGI